MAINGTLFSKNYPNVVQLSDVLDARRNSIVKRIDGISELDKLTDEFLKQLVVDTLFKPIALCPDKMTRGNPRTATVNNTQQPRHLMGQNHPWLMREHNRQITLVPISLPFSGDPYLFDYRPNRFNLSLPFGKVQGSVIHFELNLDETNPQFFKDTLVINLASITEHVGFVNHQIGVFNGMVETVLTNAFNQKFESLSKQYSVLDSVGLKLPEPKPLPDSSAVQKPQPKPKKESQREHVRNYITLVVANTIQSFSQTNSNDRDVNNEIHSNK
ncbi:hypothetical protein [Fimbriiglobus ruber]|uniref:hypothetical protein n=1 Tax=Fimbriiglobus ruber TaxID=1908690 RepID=UPI00117A0224|nr:hypothetical protein [Fimbriiglobus ruber]